MTVQLTTVAALWEALKRTGVRVVLTSSSNPKTGESMPHRYLNVPRHVVLVQQNAIALAVEPDAKRHAWSWLDRPKVTEVTFPAPGRFTIDSAGITLSYTILEPRQ